jgi:hypothetical protein
VTHKADSCTRHLVFLSPQAVYPRRQWGRVCGGRLLQHDVAGLRRVVPDAPVGTGRRDTDSHSMCIASLIGRGALHFQAHTLVMHQESAGKE